MARGIPPGEARRQARLAMGGPEQVKEQCRDERGTHWLEDLWKDVRYALRMFAKNPGTTAVAVLSWLSPSAPTPRSLPWWTACF